MVRVVGDAVARCNGFTHACCTALSLSGVFEMSSSSVPQMSTKCRDSAYIAPSVTGGWCKSSTGGRGSSYDRGICTIAQPLDPCVNSLGDRQAPEIDLVGALKLAEPEFVSRLMHAL